MRWSAQWRTSLAVWLGPVIAVIMLLQPQGPAFSLDGYRLASAAHAAAAVFFVAPICALAAAWEGGRLRRAGWQHGAHARRPLTIAVTALIPVVVIDAGLLLVSMGAAVVPGVPDLRLTSLMVCVVTAWGLVGYALGTSLAPVVALPTALLGGYAWMAFPGALEPVWVRHLNGFLFDCCSIDSALSDRAVAGSLLTALGLAGGAYLTLRTGPLTARPVRVGAAVGPVLAGLLAGAAVVHDLGPEPTTPRASRVVCAGTSVQVCVWPEHQYRLRTVLEVATTATARWRAIGLDPPTRYSERIPDVTGSSGGIGLIGFIDQSTRADLLSGMAIGALPSPTPPCAANGPFLGGDAYEYLHAWMELTAGMSADDLAQRSDPHTVAVATAVARYPVARQLRWRQANLMALTRCDVPAVTQVPA